jgi:hypothetical protein
MLSAASLVVGATVEYTTSTGMSYQLPVTRVDNVANTVTLQTSQGAIVVNQSQVSLNNQIWLAKLPLSEWTITSFDPLAKVVCIDVTSQSGVRHISVSLPIISSQP